VKEKAYYICCVNMMDPYFPINAVHKGLEQHIKAREKHDLKRDYRQPAALWNPTFNGCQSGKRDKESDIYAMKWHLWKLFNMLDDCMETEETRGKDVDELQGMCTPLWGYNVNENNEVQNWRFTYLRHDKDHIKLVNRLCYMELLLDGYELVHV
jgi:hypothetical protein